MQEMTYKDVATMAPREWLNDEMINSGIALLVSREMARSAGGQPRVHFFGSYFTVKLCRTENGYDYQAVRRWTTENKLGYDMLKCDKAGELIENCVSAFVRAFF